MTTKFAKRNKALAVCDRCGFQYPLGELKQETVKRRPRKNLVCPDCWSKDHPQLMLGETPIFDPQAIRNPRPDTSYYTSGLQTDGSLGVGSRVTQWGWNPVGGARITQNDLAPNPLASAGVVGIVTVSTV